MFKLHPNPTFTSNVHLSVPGMPSPLSVVVMYRHKTHTQLEDWLRRSKERQDVEILDEVVVGITGLLDADGVSIPYSPAVLATLVDNYPVAHAELFKGYLREMTETKAKAA